MPSPTRGKTVYICDACGKETPRWEGRCPSCGEWNTLSELSVSPPRPTGSNWTGVDGSDVVRLADVSTHESPRIKFSSHEVNRVLGGGIVPGSLTLVAGDPGIGKSTLLLGLATEAGANGVTLYASGEESPVQIKMRADRMGLSSDGLYLLTAGGIEKLVSKMRSLRPSLLVVDSIQTVHNDAIASEPGSVTQIRECTRVLMEWAKAMKLPVIISGHVTKSGDIAGPRLLEHMVDVVLQLEGESVSSWRILRSSKNRFGSTNEVGVFEMTDRGLVEVEDPSASFISERPSETPGSVVVATMEGSRPLLAEIQALTSPAVLSTPRRVASGLDFNRMLLVCAVLGRRAGISIGGQDIVVNVAGGLHVSEPASDLGIALSIASSAKDLPLSSGLAAVGEVGLGGGVRSVPQIDRRIQEALRLGLTRLIVPANNSHDPTRSKSLEIVAVSTLRQALEVAMGSMWEKL